MAEETYEQERDRHNAAFELVKPKPHWKGEIHATIRQEDLSRVSDAVGYFCGGGLQVIGRDDKAGTYEVYAPGYWAIIGS